MARFIHEVLFATLSEETIIEWHFSSHPRVPEAILRTLEELSFCSAR
jgi:hypothetical protein